MSQVWFIEQTDRFNPKLNMPLELTTWSRDIRLGGDVGMGITSTSFVVTTRNAQGSQTANGFPWLGTRATTAPTVGLDNKRVIKPVRDLGDVISVTQMEIEKARQAGTDIISGKMEALQRDYQFNTDRYLYTGASDVDVEGLINMSDVSTGNAENGDWPNASPDEIIADFTEALTAVNANSGYAVWPNRVLLPPARWNYIYSTPRASYSDKSILTYLRENNVSSANGAPLEIYPCKWLINAGVGNTQRMVVYNIDPTYIRFPMMPLRPLNVVPSAFGYDRSYVYRYGELESPYPETILYRDGI